MLNIRQGKKVILNILTRKTGMTAQPRHFLHSQERDLGRENTAWLQRLSSVALPVARELIHVAPKITEPRVCPGKVGQTDA